MGRSWPWERFDSDCCKNELCLLIQLFVREAKYHTTHTRGWGLGQFVNRSLAIEVLP